ncbi:DUF4260 family protein [Natrinema caseinilyticum]|uniref:DUF4260 family protein n=1 Tax=Natrinema caseinilyticum TaxID=2961570 RepID=UPI0021142716|nr:DUF4260 family protein [Natrinema caseinilyticum]
MLLALAPDLSTVGYLGGPRVGSLSYNVVHTYTLSLALGAVGFWADIRLALLVALVWTGHIGADRLFGYELTFASGRSSGGSIARMREYSRPNAESVDRQ